jgi:hypothetical protein
MDTGKAIFLGLALIALAIFPTDAMHPANAGEHQVGRYNISDVSKASSSWEAWVIDTSTGRYRICDSLGKCSPWRSSQ